MGRFATYERGKEKNLLRSYVTKKGFDFLFNA
jgi:hypothetical protein